MISLALARKLKEKGLKWEPQEGDWCLDAADQAFVVCEHGLQDFIGNELYTVCTWLPRLDRLLEWIEAKNYRWVISRWIDPPKPPFSISVQHCKPIDSWRSFDADSVEDAAGEAVMWIAEREAITDETTP